MMALAILALLAGLLLGFALSDDYHQKRYEEMNAKARRVVRRITEGNS